LIIVAPYERSDETVSRIKHLGGCGSDYPRSLLYDEPVALGAFCEGEPDAAYAAEDAPEDDPDDDFDDPDEDPDEPADAAAGAFFDPSEAFDASEPFDPSELFDPSDAFAPSVCFAPSAPLAAARESLR
jgi:hypothetical protein